MMNEIEELKEELENVGLQVREIKQGDLKPICPHECGDEQIQAVFIDDKFDHWSCGNCDAHFQIWWMP